jgi:transcriptional regulator with XRE-family HTH domain
MGYADKMRNICATRGIDQTSLAERVGVSKSSMSRILSGAQEPKLGLAFELAKALSVPLDYLVDDLLDAVPPGQLVVLTDDEATILKIVRRLGSSASIDRLLGVAPLSAAEDPQQNHDAAAEEASNPASGRRRGRS